LDAHSGVCAPRGDGGGYGKVGVFLAGIAGYLCRVDVTLCQFVVE
jgi:hypothetical protein